MSNVIKYWKKEERREKNDGRMNENNRQRMPILRKKVVTLQAGLQKKCINGTKKGSITIKTEWIWK